MVELIQALNNVSWPGALVIIVCVVAFAWAAVSMWRAI